MMGFSSVPGLIASILFGSVLVSSKFFVHEERMPAVVIINNAAIFILNFIMIDV
jgi:hypothetical protein